MVKRKIIQIGNSLGVTISRRYLDELNIKLGDELDVHLNKGTYRIELIPVEVTRTTRTKGISIEEIDAIDVDALTEELSKWNDENEIPEVEEKENGLTDQINEELKE